MAELLDSISAYELQEWVESDRLDAEDERKAREDAKRAAGNVKRNTPGEA